MAFRDFLTTLSYKITPNQASNKLITLIKNKHLSRLINSLEDYSKAFQGIAQELTRVKPIKAPRIFTTISSYLDTNFKPQALTSNTRTNYACPYKKDPNNKHPQKPNIYLFLEIIITSSTRQRFQSKPTLKEYTEI